MDTEFTPPTSSPLSLKILLGMIFLLSVFSSILAPYLALSMTGIKHFYLWQFGTYLFIHPFPAAIIHLIFNLFLIWTFGANLIERLHPKLFYTLFFGSGIFAGLIAWGTMLLFPSSPFMGSSSALYGLLTAWIILNPEARLLLFFAISFKTRYLLAWLIGFNLLIDLSRLAWVPLFAYIGSILFAYSLILISCRMRSPFSYLVRFENGLLRFLERVTHFRKKQFNHTKIYDIKSGDPVLNDEQFMDAMLAKVSLYGEDSLTPEEKGRMQKISEKKSSGKKMS